MKRSTAGYFSVLMFLILIFGVATSCNRSDNKKTEVEQESITTSESSNESKAVPNKQQSAYEWVDDAIRYTLGKWQEVPVKSIFETLDREAPDNTLISFYLSGYKIFQRYNDGVPQFFTDYSDGVWRSEFLFIRRTPAEIKKLLEGFKIKCLLPPERIINTSFSWWEDRFSFTNHKLVTRSGVQLREGLEFSILPLSATDYDAEYVPKGRIDFSIEAKGQTFRKTSTAYIIWREPFASLMGFYPAKQTDQPAEFPAPYEICTDEVHAYCGFQLCAGEDPLDLNPQKNGSEGLVSATINSKLFNPHADDAFATLYATPGAKYQFIFQSHRLVGVGKSEKGMTLAEEQVFFDERKKMIEKYLQLIRTE